MNSLLETSIRAAGLPEVFLSFVIVTLLVFAALQSSQAPRRTARGGSAELVAGKLAALGLALTGVLALGQHSPLSRPPFGGAGAPFGAEAGALSV
jgi:hypothetical protein